MNTESSNLSIKVLAVFFLVFSNYKDTDAQSVMSVTHGSLSLRAGYLYSMTRIKREPSSGRIFLGSTPKPGYYVGILFEKSSGNLLNRIDISYQRKGQITENLSGIQTSNNIYNYISLSPSIGTLIFKKLSLYIGPELNILLSKKTIWQNSSTLEGGATAKIRYTIKRVGFEAGYFKSFTKYSEYSDGKPFTTRYNLFNHNLQVGITYQISSF